VIENVNDMDLLKLLQSGDFFQNVIVKEGQIDSERKDEGTSTTKEWSVKRRKKMQNSQSMKLKAVVRVIALA